jgi:hypothetical protein
MPSERGKVVALKKNVLDARRKAEAKGLSSSDITEGRMRQSIAAATKASIGDTGLADAAQQARLDEGRRMVMDGTATLPVSYPVGPDRPSVLGPGPMKGEPRISLTKRDPAAAAPVMVADSLPPTSQDSLGSLGAMMGKLGTSRRRSKKSKKGGKKTKKGGRKTRRRA